MEPSEPTPFVGRIEELDAIARLVLKVSRLVTITGPRGAGKSRLAARAAEELTPRFPDGVAVVDLATTADPDQVAAALTGERLLAVWDGCEGAVDACRELVISLLRDRPQLHVLATSRIALGVPGEEILDLGPMTEADAIKLACERAGLVRITDGVRRIVRRSRWPSEVEAAAALLAPRGRAPGDDA